MFSVLFYKYTTNFITTKIIYNLYEIKNELFQSNGLTVSVENAV